MTTDHHVASVPPDKRKIVADQKDILNLPLTQTEVGKLRAIIGQKNANVCSSEGDHSMTEKYVTEDKLRLVEAKIDSKINANNANINGKLGAIDEKFNTLNETIKGGFKTSEAKIETRFAKLESSQTKWFIGTAVTIIGVVVSLLQWLG
ncbi:hypothetical protein [Lacticaseibacillus mingshuiensis]|uniref:hypothetical protein n=1 Tax=Lacticaseibacillus mingshuiensis TaxID=2799574 RepID=UPI00194DCB3A|nr:hypothetical protein [Lacticaseibacillus mingshuiensis]